MLSIIELIHEKGIVFMLKTIFIRININTKL